MAAKATVKIIRYCEPPEHKALYKARNANKKRNGQWAKIKASLSKRPGDWALIRISDKRPAMSSPFQKNLGLEITTRQAMFSGKVRYGMWARVPAPVSEDVKTDESNLTDAL